MAKGKDQGAASLRLFPVEPMTSEEAWQIVDRIPVDSRTMRARRRCRGACCRKRGAKGHGPYWFAVVIAATTGRKAQRYIGSDAKLARVRQAWELVRLEVDAAQAAAAAVAPPVEPPEVARARQLTARARGPRRSSARPQTVDVPIVEVRTK